MTEQEYKQKRRECFVKFCKDNGIDQEVNISIFDAFDQIFDRAYALGKQKETITQEEIEKVAKEYVLTRQQARHNAKREEDATLRDFDKTIKAWDAFDMEQAYEDGANFALGKQENDADTVIQGWVARDDDGQLLYLYGSMPTRGINMWNGHGSLLTPLNTGLYPDLTWESEPQEVEITIKRKKK